MAARAGFQALVVGAALMMAAGAMSDGAMAQEAEAATQTGEVAALADDTAAQVDAEQPLPQQKPAVADRPAKSDLDQSAVRPAPVTRAPRLTRTSTIVLPKILGSYR